MPCYLPPFGYSERPRVRVHVCAFCVFFLLPPPYPAWAGAPPRQPTRDHYSQAFTLSILAQSPSTCQDRPTDRQWSPQRASAAVACLSRLHITCSPRAVQKRTQNAVLVLIVTTVQGEYGPHAGRSLESSFCKRSPASLVVRSRPCHVLNRQSAKQRQQQRNRVSSCDHALRSPM